MNTFQTFASALAIAVPFSCAAQTVASEYPVDKSKLMQYRGLCVRTEVTQSNPLKPSYYAYIQPPGHAETSTLKVPEDMLRKHLDAYSRQLQMHTKDGPFKAFLKAQHKELETSVRAINADKAKGAPHVPFCDPTV